MIFHFYYKNGFIRFFPKKKKGRIGRGEYKYTDQTSSDSREPKESPRVKPKASSDPKSLLHILWLSTDSTTRFLPRILRSTQLMKFYSL